MHSTFIDDSGTGGASTCMNPLAAAGVSNSPPSHDVQRSWSRFRGRPSRSPTRTALALPAGVYEPRMSLTDSERTSDFSAFGTPSKGTPDASTNAEQSRAFSVRFGKSSSSARVLEGWRRQIRGFIHHYHTYKIHCNILKAHGSARL